MRARGNFLWVTSSGAAALAGWLLVPLLWPTPPRLARPPNARSAEWRLPDLPRKPDQAGLGLQMVGSPIFEPEAAVLAKAAPPEDARWRVAGIFGSGKERTVLIEFRAPGKKPLRLRVGGELPSGERITKIENNEVVMKGDNGLVRIGVEYRE
jgi:hypothetical protein